MESVRGFLPPVCLVGLRRARRVVRRIRYHARAVSGFARRVRRDDVGDALVRIGVHEGDTAMVYCSLSRLGHVVGGAEAVIGAFRDVLGQNGTLAMPSFAVVGGGLDYLSSNPIFDPDTTPSSVGRLSEVFRAMPDARRSIHPTHSVSAAGRLAEYITTGHELASTPFGSGTPFEKLLGLDAWFLALGVDIHVFTLYHTFEDLEQGFPFNPYAQRRISARVRDRAGAVRTVSVPVHDPERSLHRLDQHTGVREVCREFFTKQNVLTETRIGSGRIAAVRAQALYACLQIMLAQGITVYADYCTALTPGASSRARS